MTIRAITFDFWDTLFYLSERKEAEKRRRMRVLGIARAMKRNGHNVDIRKIVEAYIKTGLYANDVRERWLEEVPPSDQVKKLFEYLRIKTNKRLLDEAEYSYTSAHLFIPPRIMEGANEVIPLLSSKYTLGLISNTGVTPGSMLRVSLREEKLIEHFRHLTFSDEVGKLKPSPFIFLHTLGRLGVKAEETVHIGDDLKSDIKGAKGVGMKGILFRRDLKDEEREEVDAVIPSLKDLPYVLKDL